MPWEAWFTVGVIAAIFAALVSNRVPTDLTIIAGVTLLVLVDIFVPGAEILSTKDALAGMANSGMITVGVMFVLVRGLQETGGVQWLGAKLLGKPTSVLSAQVRMLVPVTALSAFMNNTPLVAMFIPIINDWCKKHSISPSKLMLPLSYAAIFGGTLTLIGTSTNLVVKGMWDRDFPDRHLGMFEIAWVGLPCAIVGIVYLLLASRFLIPERKPVLRVEDDPRSYTVEMVVDPAGPLVGKTVEQAGLRNLTGLFLAEIERGGQVIPAVGPDEKLVASDRLVFVGVVDSIVDLKKIRGLASPDNQTVKLSAPRPQRCLIEAVVSNTSPLVGQTIREGKFRTVYNAVVIAVARNGERILNQKIGDIQIHAGDTLLLEAHRSFAAQHKNSRDFLLVSAVEDSAPLRHEKSLLSLGILLFVVLLATFADFPPLNSLNIGMLHAAVIGAGLMLVTRCCNGREARQSVDWTLLTIIAASLGLGVALENTGAAAFMAREAIAVAGGNPWVTLAIVYGVCMLCTELITNNAAAAMMFPVALAASKQLGVDFKPFAMAIMMAASACFSTPIGYQTNLMVMAPGGYKFSDYFRVGIPLNLLMWGVAVAVVPQIWPFNPA